MPIIIVIQDVVISIPSKIEVIWNTIYMLNSNVVSLNF